MLAQQSLKLTLVLTICGLAIGSAQAVEQHDNSVSALNPDMVQLVHDDWHERDRYHHDRWDRDSDEWEGRWEREDPRDSDEWEEYEERRERWGRDERRRHWDDEDEWERDEDEWEPDEDEPDEDEDEWGDEWTLRLNLPGLLEPSSFELEPALAHGGHHWGWGRHHREHRYHNGSYRDCPQGYSRGDCYYRS